MGFLKLALPSIGLCMIFAVLAAWQDFDLYVCKRLSYDVLCKTKKKDPSLEFVVELILWQFFAHGAILVASFFMGASNRFRIGVCTLILFVGTATATSNYKLRPLVADFDDPLYRYISGLILILAFGLVLNILEPGIFTASKRRSIIKPAVPTYWWEGGSFSGLFSEPSPRVGGGPAGQFRRRPRSPQDHHHFD
mmetsp:Transcript_18390/g.23928  ORF Transcript_18390/g.23928 Transcript_18390/m.23928 type:complete len:194 (+) Transcript_18390:73-654(+)